MNDLQRAFPDANVLLALEPEELGAKLIFLVREREGDTKFCPYNYTLELSNELVL